MVRLLRTVLELPKSVIARVVPLVLGEFGSAGVVGLRRERSGSYSLLIDKE